MGPRLEKGCNPPTLCLAGSWGLSGEQARSLHCSGAPSPGGRWTGDSGERDWRSGELDPVLGRQHHTRHSPEGLWADREPKEGQLSLCALRVFLPRACVPMCGVRSSLSSPKLCQWLSLRGTPGGSAGRHQWMRPTPRGGPRSQARCQPLL